MSIGTVPVAVRVLQVLAVLLAAGGLAQPVLAGLFLGGDPDAVQWHGWVASGLEYGSIFVFLTAAYLVLRYRAPWSLLALTAVLMIAVYAQARLGYQHQVAAHVPFGVALIILLLLTAALTCSSLPTRVRPRRGGER